MKKQLLLPVAAICGMTALNAVPAVSNGGFENYNVKGRNNACEMSMDKAEWIYEKPLAIPSDWRPNIIIKKGFFRYPVSNAFEGKSCVSFKGTIMSTKFTAVKHADSILKIEFASKSSEGGFVSVYLYSAGSAFLGEIPMKITPSPEKWSESKLEINIPAEKRGKKVETLTIAFSAGGEDGMSLDAVKAELISKNDSVQTAEKKNEHIDFGDFKIPKNSSKELSFRQKDNDTRQIRLIFEARIDWTNLGGYTQAMSLSVNGMPLTGERLLNKPQKFRTRSGGDGFWNRSGSQSYVLMYSGDFSDDIKTNANYIYGLYEKEQEPYRFVFDLTGLTKHVGENSVILNSSWLPIVIRDAYIEFDNHFMPRINDDKSVISPAPVGTLEDRMPRNLSPAKISILGESGKSFVLQAGNHKFPVATRISMPGGKWLSEPSSATDVKTQEWRTPSCVMTRTIRVGENKVSISDRFTNLLEKPIGVMIENMMQFSGKPDRMVAGGVELMLKEFKISGGNPTFTAEIGKDAVSLLAEDDILRSQGVFKKDDSSATLADYSLAIPPKGSHTLEWSVYFAENAGYYDLVNQMRRDWDVNFTVTGPFSFPYGGGTGGIPFNYWIRKDVSKKVVDDFFVRRNVKNIITHVPGNYSVSPAKSSRENPMLGHGTALLDKGFDSWRNQTAAMTAALGKYSPETSVYCYLHKNICSEQGNREKYTDSAAISATYIKFSNEGVYAYYIPTRNNAYGKKLAETYKYMIDSLGTNIYMDEICLGVTDPAKYPEWDGCTGRIDMDSNELTDTVSTPNLLEREWMDDMMSYLAKRGRKLMGNAPPVTKALRDFKAMFFIEECMGRGGLFSMHLTTPVAFCYKLGEEGFGHFREALEEGIVCHQYSGEFSTHCFPLTPIELGHGYIIAKERIITGVSGVFGWNDSADAEFFVYDGKGNPASDGMVVKKDREGKTVFEVRIPGDHVAFIVRK